MVQVAALGTAHQVKMKCMHRDVLGNALLAVMIQFCGQNKEIEAMVCPQLTHPLILGTNGPGFQTLLREMLVDLSCSNG